MSDDLTGRELDEALARAIGWTRFEGDEIPKRHQEIPGAGSGVQAVWLDKQGERRACSWCGTEIPQWSARIDALLRDIWPVLQARGWDYWTAGVEDSRTGLHSAIVWKGCDHCSLVEVAADTPALALARAFLRALQEGE